MTRCENDALALSTLPTEIQTAIRALFRPDASDKAVKNAAFQLLEHIKCSTRAKTMPELVSVAAGTAAAMANGRKLALVPDERVALVGARFRSVLVGMQSLSNKQRTRQALQAARSDKATHRETGYR